MNNRWLFGAILFLLVILSHASFGHTRFDPAGNVPGRNTDPGLKFGPCGGIARTATNKMLTSGAPVRVDWQETIQHPGRFEFYFSPANDQNFVLIGTVVDDQNGAGNLPHNFNAMITMPNVTCTNCTLQLIQVMTENPAAPTLYYSCADISLSATTTTPSPVPTPAPSPVPAPTNCH